MTVPSLHYVAFHGDEIVTFEVDGERWVALRPVTEALGMSWSTQHRKLIEDGSRFNCAHMSTVGGDGKQRDMFCLPLHRFPAWLLTINPNKIPNEAKRAKVILYQEESFQALYDYWFKGAAIRPEAEGVVLKLDAATREIIGGIVKGVVRKAFLEEMPVVIMQLMPRLLALTQQGASVIGWTAGAAIKEALGKQQRISKQLHNQVSGHLCRVHEERGAPLRMADLGTSSVYVFDPTVCQDWLAGEGKTLILGLAGGRPDDAGTPLLDAPGGG